MLEPGGINSRRTSSPPLTLLNSATPALASGWVTMACRVNCPLSRAAGWPSARSVTAAGLGPGRGGRCAGGADATAPGAAPGGGPFAGGDAGGELGGPGVGVGGAGTTTSGGTRVVPSGGAGDVGRFGAGPG